MAKKTKGVIHTLEPEAFNGVYREIAEQTDEETATKICRLFRGQTIVFPQKLYDQDYVRCFVRENAGKRSIRELSAMFEYSDRRIRQFISEGKEKPGK